MAVIWSKSQSYTINDSTHSYKHNGLGKFEKKYVGTNLVIHDCNYVWLNEKKYVWL